MDSATSKVVDAGLSFLFQAMCDTLTPSFLQSLGFLFGVEGEAQNLQSTLSRIQALLKDAEDRQIKEESVRLWLRELKDAAYGAEDIVDEVKYQVLRSKIEGAQMQTRKRKLTDQVSDLFCSSVSNLNMGPRIKEIRERLEEIESRSNQLHLKVMLKSEMLIPGKRHPTSSIIDESIVFGRETDREKVVGLLTLDDDSSAANSGIQVVPICGMGGLGKTTLAQLAYNDERVDKHFVVKAWVYVSEEYNVTRLANAIVKSVTGSDPHLMSLDPFQVSIKEALKGNKFLLVLDDVWNENFNDWDTLRTPLMVGARGSRILVTTRSQRVSSNMGTVPTHFLQCLSDDDCWSLFESRAFVQGSSDAHPDLVKIGKEIVNKCKGLPLAVKTLGGLLRSNVDVVDWKSILQSEMWDLPEERNDILPALRLSYHHLPAHLKRCFEFCYIFPKGSYFMYRDRLVWSWMAHGFIQSEGSRDMEDIGEEYLTDLVSRSLLYKEGSLFKMHDLIHGLARSSSGAEIFEIRDWKSHKNAEKAHGGNAESSGLTDVFNSHVEHLTTSHFDFLQRWDRLIDLEAKVTQVVKTQIWHSSSSRRENNSSSLSSIVLDVSSKSLPKKPTKDCRFVYRFVNYGSPLYDLEMQNEDDPDGAPPLLRNFDRTLKCGDCAILSTESRRLAVANGVITEISRSYVSIRTLFAVSFSRRRRLPGSSPSEIADLMREVWRIDEDEVTSSYGIMRVHKVLI